MGRTGGNPLPTNSGRGAHRWAASLLLVALASSACQSALPASDDAIRIGMSVWPGYEALYLAQEVGIYEDLGVDVEIVEFTSASDALRAFVHGQIDGMASTLIELLALRDRDIDARASLLLDYSDGGDMLMVDESVGSLAELAGKAVAVEPQSVGLPLLDHALRAGGLSTQDVDVRLVDQLEMPVLAESGLVQAAVTYVPRSFELEDRAGFRPIYTSADMPVPVPDVLAFDAGLVEDRLGEVAKIVEAWERAIDYAATNTDRAVRILAEREGIDPNRFLASLDLMRVVSLEQQHDLFVSGRLERICDRNLAHLVRLDVVSSTAPRGECTTAEPIAAQQEASR